MLCFQIKDPAKHTSNINTNILYMVCLYFKLNKSKKYFYIKYIKNIKKKF